MIPFIITPIKWLPYPENINKIINTTKYLLSEYSGGVSRRFGAEIKHIDKEYGVNAFAELPAPYDPASEEFDFTTAVELMKAGNRCKSVQSGIILHVYDDEHETVFKQTVIKNDNTSYWDYNLSYDEILGKWRLA